jgi:TfoX/Sxy family transcriptional regulator of competence genes
MPYDEGLAQRIRELLDGDERVREKHMFGGVAFLANGAMAVGVIRDELMVRVGPAAYEAALALPHARPMDFTGRPMRGFVQVAPAGFEDDADLSGWIARGVGFAALQKERGARSPSAKAGKRAKAKQPARAGRKPARGTSRPRAT